MDSRGSSMAHDEHVPDDDGAVPEPRAAARRQVTEDWAATILGLVLLLLAMAGVITKGMIP